MIPRGKTVKSVEAYYTTLKELSAPYEREYLCWNKSLEYYRKTHPRIKAQLDTAMEAYMTEKYVTMPLNRVYAAILSFIIANTQWTHIELSQKHPLLDAEIIFHSLRKLPDENLQLAVRMLSCSYEQKLILLNSVKSDDVDNFSSVFKLIDNADILSDLCWEYCLYEPLVDPYDQLMKEITETALSEGKYDVAEDGLIVIKDDYEDPTEEEILESCDSFNEAFYLKYLQIRRLISKRALDFYDRELMLFQDIINRPEGKVFANKYQNEPLLEETPSQEEFPAVEGPVNLTKTVVQEKQPVGTIEEKKETTTSTDEAQTTKTSERLSPRCSIDDFINIKDDWKELYETIQNTLGKYNEDDLSVFCQSCRFPLEQALEEIYKIADIKDMPEFAGKRIGRLKTVLPKELFSKDSIKLFSDLNRITSDYSHNKKNAHENWNKDAQLCYESLTRICDWLIQFKIRFSDYLAANGPINYEKVLSEHTLAIRNSPEHSSLDVSRIPDLSLNRLWNKDAKDSYQLELKKLFCQYLPIAQSKCQDYCDRLTHLLEPSDSLSESSIKRIERLKSILLFLPRLAAVEHIFSYSSVVHPILFSSSWTPQQLSLMPFAGGRFSAEEIYDALVNGNTYVARIILQKIDGPLSASDSLLDAYENRNKNSFVTNVKKLTCDISVLHDFAGLIPFISSRDYGLLNDPDGTIEWLQQSELLTQTVSPLLINQESVFLDLPSNLSPSIRENWIAKLLKRTEDGILSYIVALHSRLRNNTTLFDFERKYILDILEDTKFKAVFGSIDGSPSFIMEPNQYHFSLPQDLFSGIVDKYHTFIPGLKNEFKNCKLFDELFNYILSLGGITTDEEAGALLRVFTGYPVENADEKARWETDYHVLYYLVKYMFTGRGNYTLMSKCIDISYPSDDERQKAEKSPSAYAERIGGDEGPYIIETLSRLSTVFPKPTQPFTD